MCTGVCVFVIQDAFNITQKYVVDQNRKGKNNQNYERLCRKSATACPIGENLD